MQLKFGAKTYFKTKFEGLDGKVQVVFTEEMPKKDNEQSFGLQATASRASVLITGPLNRTIESQEDLHALAAELGSLIDAAYKEHRLLQPKLTKSLSGH